MSDFDFLSRSRQLLKELNWFLLHIAVYLIANMLLVLFIYGNTAARWPLLFVIFLWAMLLILHGLRINNKKIFRSNKKSMLVKGIIRLGGY